MYYAWEKTDWANTDLVDGRKKNKRRPEMKWGKGGEKRDEVEDSNT
jgi:hypothetical protein